MKKALPASRLPKLTEQEIAERIPVPDVPFPKDMQKGDCCYPGAPRPCPLVSYKWNNYLTVSDVGTIILTWPDKQPEDVDPKKSCACDVMERGQTEDEPLEMREIAEVLNCTKQNVDLIIKGAREHGARILRRIRRRTDED